MTTSALDDPLYYLNNFRQVLDWISLRYDDLLDEQERRFIADFSRLPAVSQALLVRMVMRRGSLFRASKLQYPEIGALAPAMAPLVAHGWVDAQPALELPRLFALLTRPELLACLPAPVPRSLRKDDWLAALLAGMPEAQTQTLRCWAPGLDDAVFP